MDPKLWVFPMDHRGTGDSLGTAGEGAGIELQRPQHARVTNVLGLNVVRTGRDDWPSDTYSGMSANVLLLILIAKRNTRLKPLLHVS